MDSKTCVLFILCVFLKLFVLSIAQDSSIHSYCNSDYNGTYTATSTFKKNIETIPSVLYASATSFYNFSLGNRADTLNVIALCRGDVDIDRCERCLRKAHYELTTKCSNQKESIIWKDECMLRYSDRPIFKIVNTLPNAFGFNQALAPDANDFNKKVRSLLDKLQEQASTGTSVSKFATGNISVIGNWTVYGLVQCTPDLTTKQCKDCLNASFAELPSCCNGTIGGRIVMPSCNFRYETGSPFYNGTGVDIPPQTHGSPAPSSLPGKGNDDRKTKVTSVIVLVLPITSAVLVSLVCIIGIYICCFRNKKHLKGNSDALNVISSEECVHFDFDTVKSATKNFGNILGSGGFGDVYKGVLSDGREIAVKRWVEGSKQDEVEFKTEVKLLANLQHKGLVKLLGYSIRAAEKLLIYEFIANGSLDKIIFDTEKRNNLNGDTRIKIITGVAQGLQYLHEYSRLRIIHRDMKPGNILLDSNMCPKIADFGIARLFEAEQTRDTTSKIVGTHGYMAPEYRVQGRFSVKLDVFSFGVVVLEIITGQRNNFRNPNKEYLPSYVWKKWRVGRFLDVIDPILRNGGDSVLEMRRCMHIALLCVQKNAVDRPTMKDIVHMLNTASALQEPSEPAFLNNTGSDTSGETQPTSSKSQEIPLALSNNGVTITDLIAR